MNRKQPKESSAREVTGNRPKENNSYGNASPAGEKAKGISDFIQTQIGLDHQQKLKKRREEGKVSLFPRWSINSERRRGNYIFSTSWQVRGKEPGFCCTPEIKRCFPRYGYHDGGQNFI